MDGGSLASEIMESGDGVANDGSSLGLLLDCDPCNLTSLLVTVDLNGMNAGGQCDTRRDRSAFITAGQDMIVDAQFDRSAGGVQRDCVVGRFRAGDDPAFPAMGR
jgi:hypothetical protein